VRQLYKVYALCDCGSGGRVLEGGRIGVDTVVSVWIEVGGAMSRRAAWWLLLARTVIGLASMRTLGHGPLSSALHVSRSTSPVVAGPADSHGGLAPGDLPGAARASPRARGVGSRLAPVSVSRI
jgi:hypothetical protein